jgi:hypothetical protein
MAEFNGNFYIGMRNIIDGGEVWRTSNGVNFSPVFTGGYGNVDNQRPYGLITFNNYLYLVFCNLSTGAEVWRTSNGISWEQVGFNGWGEASNTFADYLDKGATIFNNSLFIGTFNDVTGGQIWQMLFSPDAVSISGPTLGMPGQAYTFTASILPITTTLPITYSWQATDMVPQIFVGGITSTVTYNWGTNGIKEIALSASNGAATVSDTHIIHISILKNVYLPISVR